MRNLPAVIAALALAIGTYAFAQEGNQDRRPEAQPGTPPTISPEMWAYIQELRRQDDPKQTVRRVAAEKAQQRRNRLASQAWYGYSNLRPVASPMPFTTTYSPSWTGNNLNEYQWTPAAGPTVMYMEDYYRR